MTDAAARKETLEPEIARLLKRDPAGLVTAVIQDELTREVLMVGWMDDVALHRTLTTGRTTFFSRSRARHWVKGETSGHRQWVRRVQLDCDGDTVLVTVIQEGAACHTGDRSCFDARRLPAAIHPKGDDPLEPPRGQHHPKGDDLLEPPKGQHHPKGDDPLEPPKSGHHPEDNR